MRTLSFIPLLAAASLYACDPGGEPEQIDAGAGEDAGPAPTDAGPAFSLPRPDEPLPESLAALGALDSDATPVDELVPYAPDYPLWTNGSVKDRALWLPPGETIPEPSGGSFELPTGAYLFKTFSYDGAPVETRVMRRTDDGWEFAVYAWDGDDATLLDAAIPTDVEVDALPDGVTHQIPSIRDCRTCHESNAGGAVIGFTPQQLVDQLPELVARGVFAAPPSAPPPIEGDDALETATLRYVYGNCVHCHNGLSGPNRAFDMRPSAFVDNVVGVETQDSAAPRGLRVAAGDPEASILYTAVTAETGFVMPPIGVQLVDADGLSTLRAWIESLE